MKEPDPYCYNCNGTGKYSRSNDNCYCMQDNYFTPETPIQAINRIWNQAFENAKDPLKTNVYPPHYSDPITNFVQSLAYCDWYDDKSQKWIDEFTIFAAGKLEEYFK